MGNDIGFYGFIRTATVVPSNLIVGDVIGNANKIHDIIGQLIADGVRVAVFPELCLTGYTCGELFRSDALLSEIVLALHIINKACAGDILVYVGAPLKTFDGSALYNCAIALAGRDDYIVIPKRNLPNYCEFYEKRWFTEYDGNAELKFAIKSCKHQKSGLIQIDYPNVIIGAEICEDMWVPDNPSSRLAQNGAKIIVNLSGGNEIVGKADYRRKLIEVTSAKNICGYIYCNAGMYESTQDMVFSGHSIIAENGSILAESKPFGGQSDAYSNAQVCVTEIDVKKLTHDRLRQDTFKTNPTECYHMPLSKPNHETTLLRDVNPFPFVPCYEADLLSRCEAITNMQVWGLVKRIQSCKCQKLVIGISGGLDSTLALLVAVDAMNILKRPLTDIIGITMPGMGTTSRTKNNAVDLMVSLGISVETIPIKDAVVEHLNSLNHSLDVHDVTYENAQARERTQILFDYANMHNGIVVGTGDLSELALGWCTYNGDQMSNYGVNASIPKTLVKYLVNYYATRYAMVQGKREVWDILKDIINTPISPELLPADTNGNIVQNTEDTVGSYELIDFFMYNMLRCGCGPNKMAYLAREAARKHNIPGWTEEYVHQTLSKFIKRFFAMQFKRSCMPDGPKVGSVTLSPRGDWRMPSDASPAAWLRELGDFTEH